MIYLVAMQMEQAQQLRVNPLNKHSLSELHL